MVEEDTPDPDEPTLEQLQALERELMRVVGNRGVPFGPVLLPWCHTRKQSPGGVRSRATSQTRSSATP
jgi:hypothetical protein